MRHRRAFTLLELLVVVAVLAALAAILFPVFAQVRESARRATCLSNLRQLILAQHMYAQDHDETLPAWYYEGPPRQYTYWTEFMRPYYGHPGVLDQGFSSAVDRQNALWLADYALCAWGKGGQGTAADPYWRWPGAPVSSPGGMQPMKLTEVQRPSETLQFCDGLTTRNVSAVWWKHTNGMLNAAFADGHVRAVKRTEYEQVDHDERGYFYHLAAADR
jgi:prepilin-type N-terminal cleavage/methylation domain-containing protein/prepilin-type processing-associated H-X9-DG protein